MKKAFTLAEVLITLGIIGIVAAMTLPTLIQKQQEKVLINQLKVANNTLSNMLLLAYKDHDTMQFWSNDYSQGSTYMTYNRTNFEKYFLPYLKVAKYCKSGKGCFSEDIYFNENSGDNINTNSNYVKALLANGMSISAQGLSFNAYGSGSFLVDVNGFKGPNEWGKDLFYFAVSPQKRGIYPSFSNEFKGTSSTEGWYSTSNRYGNCYQSMTSDYKPYKAYCTGWALRQENMNYLRCKDTNCKEE